MIIWAIIVNAIIEPMSFFLLSLSQIILDSKQIQNNTHCWESYHNPNRLSIHLILFSITILKIVDILSKMMSYLSLQIKFKPFNPV